MKYVASETWVDKIDIIDEPERVQGGLTGPTNRPIKELADCVAWLKKKIDALGITVDDFDIPEEPAGIIKAYGGATAPDRHLFCDGAAVSRTTYARLFAAIGTRYGAGDGETTFALPDLRGAFPRGAKSTTEAVTKGGAETVTLKTNEMPSHAHNVAAVAAATDGAGWHNHYVVGQQWSTWGDGNHNHYVNPVGGYTDAPGDHNHYVNPVGGNTDGGGNHNHGNVVGVNPMNIIASGISDYTGVLAVTSSAYLNTDGWHGHNIATNAHWTEVSGNHAHAIAVYAHYVDVAGWHAHTFDVPAHWSDGNGTHAHNVTVPGQTSGYTGGGEAHNNLPPFVSVNFIITI